MMENLFTYRVLSPRRTEVLNLELDVSNYELTIISSVYTLLVMCAGDYFADPGFLDAYCSLKDIANLGNKCRSFVQSRNGYVTFGHTKTMNLFALFKFLKDREVEFYRVEDDKLEIIAYGSGADGRKVVFILDASASAA